MKFIYAEINKHYREYIITPNMVELRNISLVALLIIQSAMERKESRGLHYLIDYPEKSNTLHQTIFRKKKSELTWEIEIKESRGLHYLLHYPEKSKALSQTIFRKKKSEFTWEIEMLEERRDE